MPTHSLESSIKPPRPKVVTIPLWVEEEPPDTAKIIQNVLSNKFDYD